MEKEGFILRRDSESLTKDDDFCAVLWRKEG